MPNDRPDPQSLFKMAKRARHEALKELNMHTPLMDLVNKILKRIYFEEIDNVSMSSKKLSENQHLVDCHSNLISKIL